MKISHKIDNEMLILTA